MPVDSSIALAGKPPVLPEVDFNKTFLTLGQLKYLQAEAARTEAQTGLLATQGQAALADLAASNRLRAVDPTGGGTLSSLRTAPQPQPGGPPFDTPTLAALPPGGETPAPGAPTGPPAAGSPPQGTAPAPPQVSTMALARQYMAADPIKGAEVASKLFDHDKQALDATKTQLELGQTRLTIASNAYQGVHDQASLDFANQTIMHVTGLTPDHLVQVYDPARLAQAQDMQRTAQQHLDQKNKEVEQAIEKQKATSGAVLADAAKTTAGAAKTTAESYEVIPTGDGFVRFRKATGEIDRQSGLGLTPTQAARVQEINTQYMGENKDFLQARDAYGRSKEGFAKNTGPGDIMGMYGWGKVADPGAIVQPGQMAHMEQVGTAWQGFWKEYNRLVSDPSARLDPTVRQHYLETLETTHARQVADHQKLRTETQKRGRTLLPGLDPDLYAPDLTSTAQPSSPAAPGKPERANLAPPPPGSKLEAVKSVSLKELQETVDLANKQGRKTPSGQRFTLEYLRQYFKDNGVEVRP